MSDYTPTTEEVRGYYGYCCRMGDEAAGWKKGLAEFDRWLADHDAEVRADEREKVKHDVSDACVAVQRRALNGEAIAMWEFASVVMHAAAARGDGERSE